VLDGLIDEGTPEAVARRRSRAPGRPIPVTRFPNSRRPRPGRARRCATA
jgi:hypothetical protein